MAHYDRFEDLPIWQAARVLAAKIYRLTNIGLFLQDFGLRNQAQRAAVSIVSNIADAVRQHGDGRCGTHWPAAKRREIRPGAHWAGRNATALRESPTRNFPISSILPKPRPARFAPNYMSLWTSNTSRRTNKSRSIRSSRNSQPKLQDS